MTGEEALAFIRSASGRRLAQDYLSGVLWADSAAALHLARLDGLRKKLRRGLPAEAEIQAEEQALFSAYAVLKHRRRAIAAAIGRMPEEIVRRVMTARYLEGRPFFRIAMDLHYDERQIYRIHRKGLMHAAAQIANGQISEKFSPN